MFETFISEIYKQSQNKKLFLIGITGLDASGKSQLAQILASEFQQQQRNVLSVSGDSFQFPREYKEDLQEESWALQHIHRTINFAALRQNFLEPLQFHPTSIVLNVVDYDTGQRVNKAIDLSYPLIVIVESIYLFQPGIQEYFDYKIFLDIDIEKALERAKVRPRDLELYGSQEGIEKKYRLKNFAGFELFDSQVNPKQFADVIIDNTDWGKPVISFTNIISTSKS